jgi:hypothetical protein
MSEQRRNANCDLTLPQGPRSFEVRATDLSMAGLSNGMEETIRQGTAKLGRSPNIGIVEDANAIP